jgi:hypothetical protein|uniref:Proliferating cell nuclear antigen PCNA N-terminal domain-containing protein n=1 Tax=viral metagenome TaxID=1070528 RepID=A0A6C0IZ52_9ZZZZ
MYGIKKMFAKTSGPGRPRTKPVPPPPEICGILDKPKNKSALVELTTSEPTQIKNWLRSCQKYGMSEIHIYFGTHKVIFSAGLGDSDIYFEQRIACSNVISYYAKKHMTVVCRLSALKSAFQKINKAPGSVVTLSLQNDTADRILRIKPKTGDINAIATSVWDVSLMDIAYVTPLFPPPSEKIYPVEIGWGSTEFKDVIHKLTNASSTVILISNTSGSIAESDSEEEDSDCESGRSFECYNDAMADAKARVKIHGRFIKYATEDDEEQIYHLKVNATAMNIFASAKYGKKISLKLSRSDYIKITGVSCNKIFKTTVYIPLVVESE